MRNATRRTLALIVVVVGTLTMQGTAQAAEPSQEKAMSTALARAQKFGTVESVSVASMTAGQAAAAGGAPSESEPITFLEPETPVNNVTVEGRFSDYLAHTPRNAPTPTGTEMTFTINKATGFILMLGLRGQRFTGATAARVRAKTASMARTRAHIASWGKSRTTGDACSQGENHHCYAVAGWYMPTTGGGGEEVEGAIDDVLPTTMDVPGWASGDFVDQEGWTSFPSTGYWVESGATAGEYMDCCSIHAFWARENGEGYLQAVDEWTWSGERSYREMATGGGKWNVYWDGSLIQGNLGGFSTYSKFVQAGTEIAANTKPSAAAEIDTAVWWTEGTEHNWSYENEKYADEGMCLGRDGRHPALGNITTGTC
jgi:hypothetical protein